VLAAIGQGLLQTQKGDTMAMRKSNFFLLLLWLAGYLCIIVGAILVLGSVTVL
jgi:hypothetical protein